MFQRKKIIILTAILIVIGAGIAAFFIFRQAGSPVAGSQKSDDGSQAENGSQSPASSLPTGETPVANKENQFKMSLLQQAADFAAKFNSYSVENNFANIAELRPRMTEKMQGWSDQYVEAQKKGKSPDFGIASKTVKKEVVSFRPEGSVLAAEEAMISVSLQCQETAPGREKNYYQSAEVELVKEGNSWKINSLEWK